MWGGVDLGLMDDVARQKFLSSFFSFFSFFVVSSRYVLQGLQQSKSNGSMYMLAYSMILVTIPVPTVFPPSLRLKRWLSSTGVFLTNSISISTLSPGDTIAE